MKKETLSEDREKPDASNGEAGPSEGRARMELSREYTAGIIDGEGYISIGVSHDGGVTRYFPTMKVAMTHPEVIRLLYYTLGGHVGLRRRMVKANHRLSFCWGVRNFNTASVALAYCQPYLIVKRAQAALLREFLTLKSFGVKVSAENQAKRHTLYTMMRDLNHRGRPPAETERERSLGLARDEATVRTMRNQRMEVLRNAGLATI